MALQAQSRQPPLIWPSPRPRSRSTSTLLRSEPRKHADTTAHFVDKPHFAPQNKYRLVFFLTCAQVAELADALASGTKTAVLASPMPASQSSEIVEFAVCTRWSPLPAFGRN